MYMLGDRQLERANTIKDLGVIIDTKLTFKNHFEHVRLKVTKK